MAVSIFDKCVSDKSILEKSNVVYLLTNKLNLMRYVGKTTKKLRLRLYQHRNLNNTYIDRSIQKYGWENFSVEILEECETPEQLNEREIFWIKFLDTKRPNGYNLTDGGDGNHGYIVSEKTRKLRSENSPLKRAVRCIDTNQIFSSITAAAKSLNISETSIWKVCNRIFIRANGLKFEYLDDPLTEKEKLREAKKIIGKAVRCIDTNENFDSISEAAKYFNLCKSHVSAVCNGRLLSTGHLHFEYVQKQKPENKTFPVKKAVRCEENGIIYGSIKEASRQTGISNTIISRACRKENATGGGYHWQFVQ